MTRSHIGITMPDGSVRYVYCRSSGYPTSQGVIIEQHWQDPRQAAALIELGSLSCLGTHLDDIMAYARDYGKDPLECRTRTAGDIEEFLNQAMDNDFIEFAYLLTPAGWLCADNCRHGPSPLVPLGEAIETHRRNNPRTG